MDDWPKWTRTLVEKLDLCLELDSMGTVSFRYIDVEAQLLIAPGVIELVGGKDDGESVFPSIHLDVSELISVFDPSPHVAWSTRNDELHVEGTINGEEAWVTFLKHPFDDEEPSWVLDQGDIRPRQE